jgi:hypothetical protein
MLLSFGTCSSTVYYTPSDMNHYYVFLALLLTLMVTENYSQISSFKVTARKPADKAEFVSEGEKLVVNVSSADGIGSTTIINPGGK